MIKKSQLKIVRERFGVVFWYIRGKKEDHIKVFRLGSSEVLCKIKFWGGDKLKNYSQFDDACTAWCDQNAA